ncbi:hypothetical protein ABZ891_38875 [Streptomyces sp. NPDC047023]|uniref:hypothetical protein n=1 Tax=Streptomyces sp. NPDC047023 TaxID=3155139 RepID=UPI00340EC9D9
MPERHTVLRSLHDVGLAAWFGGSLMGAVGLNGTARAEGASREESVRIAGTGWAMWAPVGAAAIGLHLIGAGGLLAADAPRALARRGVAATALTKTLLTGGALAATVCTRALGRKIELAASTGPQDEEEAGRALRATRRAERQLSWAQWSVPALTCGLIVVEAFRVEQRRPGLHLPGMWRSARTLAPYAVRGYRLYHGH